MNTKMVAEGITIKYSMINMDKIHDAPTAIAPTYIILLVVAMVMDRTCLIIMYFTADKITTATKNRFSKCMPL